MTRGSIREYTEAVRGRYLRATRKEKGQVLNEFTKVTGYQADLSARSPPKESGVLRRILRSDRSPLRRGNPP